MAEVDSIDVLLLERARLIARIEQEREGLGLLQDLVTQASDRLASQERSLEDIDEILGKRPQLSLDHATIRLRGQRLEQVAIQVLREECGEAAEVHYRDWFELLRSRGHTVGGKHPLNTFLAQINRSPAVESVGNRSGRYRLDSEVA